MSYDHILIRYGELALKGKNRKHFIRILKENIKAKLKDFTQIKIKDERDFMYILLNGEEPHEIIERCKNVFGIHSISLAMKVENEVEAIKEAALSALKQEQGETFKVAVKNRIKNFQLVHKR